MDSEYLKVTVGEPLAMAMAAAQVAQAEDQVDFVARWLLNYVNVQKELARLAEEAEAMAAARASLQAEADAAAAAAAAEQAAKDAVVGAVADSVEDKEACYQAAFSALLEHSFFSSAYVAEVDFNDIPKAEGEEEAAAEAPADGEAPKPEGPKPASGLRYVSGAP